ncbi:MAG: methyltransferase [Desulfobacterales bacterium]|nr:methyltransferase [Desulfobacterales bacterium]
MDGASFTEEWLFEGGVKVVQPQKGYRFSLDSILLAHFVGGDKGETLLDIGCGCGVMAFLMAHRRPDLKRIVGVEIQRELAACACMGANENPFGSRLCIVHADIKKALPKEMPQQFDLILSNPPFTPLGKGRLNPSSQKTLCRHEVTLTLESLISRSSTLLSPHGGLYLIYPASRLEELYNACEKFGLHPFRLRMVCSKAGDSPYRVLFACSPTPRQLKTLPHLVVHHSDGSLTDDVNDDDFYKKMMPTTSP